MARIITIARGIGSGGRTVGKMLSEDMGIKYYDKELIKLASDESGINERFFGLVDEKLKGSFLRNRAMPAETLAEHIRAYGCPAEAAGSIDQYALPQRDMGLSG